MKNKILFPIFSLLISVSLFAQSNNKNICNNGAVMSWSSVSASPFVVSTPGDAKEIIQEIIDVIGLKPNFEIMAAKIPNAAAVIYGGKRFVLYNPDFINSLTKTTGNKWAAVSVLAHEIGHHLNGHTLSQIGSQPQSELEADEFSGFVLRKMGASLSDAQAAMKTGSSVRGDATHPGQYDRLVAIADGWNKADGQITGKIYVAKSKPLVEEHTVAEPGARTVSSQPVIDEKNIIGEVSFNADASAVYYVTSRYNLVKVKNNQLSVIGKLATLNNRRYPYLIYDEANTQLLVDVYGNIITKDGRTIGKMRSE